MIDPEAQARIARLSFKRRHTDECQRRFKFSGEWTQLDGRQRCSCPFWVLGVLFDDKGHQRRSTGESSLDQANALVLHWLSTGSTATKPADPNRIRVVDAIAEFMTYEEKDREAKESTLKKYRTLMDQLHAFADWKGYRYIQELGHDAVLEFRRSWEDDAGYKLNRKRKDGRPLWKAIKVQTARRQAKILRAFFDRAVMMKWIPENPTAVIVFKREPARKRTKDQVKYLTPDQLSAILSKVDDFDRMTPTNKQRLKVLILTMRWAGLRISDAVELKREHVQGDVLYRITRKASTPVQIPLPDALATMLNSMAPYSGGYFFWDRRKEDSKPATAKTNFTVLLIAVFRKAGVKEAGDRKLSHMFRNTFAVDLLEKGVPLETVSLLLGHQSVTTTEKYYADFSKGYMDRAEQLVRKTWGLKEGEKLG